MVGTERFSQMGAGESRVGVGDGVGGWMLDVGCSTPPGRSPPMKSWRWNGKKFVDSKSVPLTDRGFRYGMSLLESFKVINGQPEFFEKHLMRLLSACAELEIEVSEAAVRRAESIFAGSGLDGFARIYVTAGDGAPTAAAASATIAGLSANSVQTSLCPAPVRRESPLGISSARSAADGASARSRARRPAGRDQETRRDRDWPRRCQW